MANSATNSDAALVELKDISIAFGGIKAVDRASVDLHAGEVVGLLGHNGAGKSTLIKILSGAYPRDSGEIHVDGQAASIANPRDAKAYGIETIYQTLALADNVDTAANLYLGRELRTAWGTLDDVAMEAKAREVMGAAAVGGHCPGDPVQRPYSDHGRADCGAWTGRNRSGGGTHPAIEGGRNRYLPDQP